MLPAEVGVAVTERSQVAPPARELEHPLTANFEESDPEILAEQLVASDPPELEMVTV